jgi:hypothetical protein
MYNDSGEGPSAHDIQTKINSLGGKCTIARETAPTTGRTHMHVFAVKDNSFNTRNAKYFDIIIYHPNIKAITSNARGVWDYVTKNGNILVQEVPRPAARSKKSSHSREVFLSAWNAPDYESSLRIIREGDPRTFYTAFNSISSATKYRFPGVEAPIYTNPDGLQIDLEGLDDIDEWLKVALPNRSGQPGGDAESVTDQLTDATPSLTSGGSSDWGSFATPDRDMGPALFTEEFPAEWDPIRYESSSPKTQPQLSHHQARPKSLILWGRSRTGKTLFARSLGRHVYHATEFNLACHTEDAEYAIFDDLKDGLRTKGFDYKCWLGGQLQFNATDKYTRKRVVSWGKPTIYITNDDPFEARRGDIDFEWLRANVTVVNIDKNIAWVQ